MRRRPLEGLPRHRGRAGRFTAVAGVVLTGLLVAQAVQAPVASASGTGYGLAAGSSSTMTFTNPGTTGTPSSFTLSYNSLPAVPTANGFSFSPALPAGLASSYAVSNTSTCGMGGATSCILSGTVTVTVTSSGKVAPGVYANEAIDYSGPQVVTGLTIVVNAMPAPTAQPTLSVGSLDFFQGVSSTGTVKVENAAGASNITVTNLPAGLDASVDLTPKAPVITVTGSASSPSSSPYDAIVRATLAGGTFAVLTLPVYVWPGYTINASGGSASFVERVPSSGFTIATTPADGEPAATLALDASTTLPTGLTFSGGSDQATISGTPGAGTQGSYAVMVDAEVNGVVISQKQFQVVIGAAPRFNSQTPGTETFTYGVQGQATITTTGTPTPSLVLDPSSNTPPAGLTFKDNGNGTATLSGTPTALTPPTSDAVTVDLLVGGAVVGTEQYLVRVLPASPVFTSPDTATFTQGLPVDFTVSANTEPPGQGLAFIYDSTSLPPGLTMVQGSPSTAQITGTPTKAGTYKVSIEATSQNGPATYTTQSTQTLTITVNPPPTFVATQSSVGFTVGVSGPTSPAGSAFDIATTETSGSPPVSLALYSSTLPNGLTFTPGANGTATITGTPTTATTTPDLVTVVAQMNGTTVASEQLAVTVAKGSQAITFKPPNPSSVSFPGTFQLDMSGGSSGNPVVATSLTITTCTVTGDTVTLGSSGTCILQLSQAGNASYNAAPILQEQISVGKVVQVISVTPPPPSTVDIGTSLTLTPASTSSQGFSGIPITVSSGDTSVCTVDAAFTVDFVAAGSCVLDYSEMGNAFFDAASAQATITVTLLPQVITSRLPLFGYYGTSQGLNRSVSGGASGNPLVYASSTPLRCTTTGAHGATLTLVGVGICAVEVTQAGGGNYAAATPEPLVLYVMRAPQVITFDPASPQTYGGTLALTATGGASGKAVVFYVDDHSLACKLMGDTLSFTGIGSCQVSASQEGNADYARAHTVYATIVVNPASQAITFHPAAPTTGTYGATATLAATGGGSGNPVMLASTTTGVCTTTGTDGATVTYVGVGTCTLTANQAGSANGDYTAAPQQTLTIMVGPQSQTIVFTPSTTGTVGTSVTLTATGGASGSPVTFASSTTDVCTTSGTNGSTLTYLGGGGTCTVTASQAGSANGDYAAASVTVSIEVPAHTNTNTSTITSFSSVGGGSPPVSFVSTVPLVTGITPNVGPTGGGTTVTITGNNLSGATSVLFGSTPAHFTTTSDTTIVAVSPPGTGSPSITVELAGDSSLSVGPFSYTSTVEPQETVSPLLIGVTLARSGGDVGTAVIFHATVAGGSSVNGGTVTFKTGSLVLCTAAVSGGQATCSRPTLPKAGSMDVVGIYTTSSGGKGAVADVSVTVAREKVALSATASMLANGRERFRASVTPAHGGFGVPHGWVTFFSGRKGLCAGKVVNEVATCTAKAVKGGILARFHSGPDYVPAHVAVRMS